MYSTAFWCLFVVLLFFLALLRSHGYSFHHRWPKLEESAFKYARAVKQKVWNKKNTDCFAV